MFDKCVYKQNLNINNLPHIFKRNVHNSFYSSQWLITSLVQNPGIQQMLLPAVQRRRKNGEKLQKRKIAPLSTNFVVNQASLNITVSSIPLWTNWWKSAQIKRTYSLVRFSKILSKSTDHWHVSISTALL